ncbi:hypothetical protein PHYBOEH_010110 [Phytophthora boehmeriae]|uniref:DDE-1 domain-containing protein n=1 Tax=Phytophthora boehmeriae TaxID=109152 RepID=A0A8T1WXT2_9STRA|nr:hypothetical protein PHYBOEH_010110 [Phytophthora boehmeriae]
MKRATSPSAASEAAPGKKKRRSQPMGNLTNLQKRQLCVKFSQVKMTQQELCQWAKREFQLAHLPHQSTISKILARADELTQMAPRDLDLASASASIAETALDDSSVPDSTQSLTQTEIPQAQPLAQPHPQISAEEQTVSIDSTMMPTMPTTMQPMDAGIIMAFKRRYRRYHMLYALDRHEAGRQDVFHVGQLQAMRWARHCWKQELSEDIIRKCWAVTEIVTPKPSPETLAAFETIEEDIDKEICDTVQSLNILRPLQIDDFVSPRDENVEIHCAGSDDSDFMYTVPDAYTSETKSNDKKFSTDGTDAIQQQQSSPIELTPRLQELHARIEASASSAATISAVSLATNTVIGESTGTVSVTSGTAVDVLGLSAPGLTAENISDAPASNEQLIECFKVLLPELDRLRFDDHTKKSIRTTFRKLKETTEQQMLDRKRGTVKKPLPPPQYPPHMQPATHQQQLQQLQQQQQQLQEQQQLHEQLLEQQQQQLAQSMAAAQTAHIEENATVL